VFTGDWRDFIYPMGFAANLCFTLRFIYQWLNSEYRNESVVTKGFWKISLAGNCILFLHATLQLQLHVALIQSVNAVISWRNLDLMKKTHRNLGAVFFLFAALILFTLLLFYLQNPEMMWFRTPTFFYHIPPSVSPFWHGAGFVGVVLFASRFWVQWWSAEKAKKSVLSEPFWWLSLVGALLSITYFLYLRDIVNLIGPAFGLIPYSRNLVLIRRRAA